MKKTLVLTIIFLSLCIALTLVILQIDFSDEEEFVQEFLQRNYNISENDMNSFSQVFLDQDGIKTEKELERYTKKTYGKYFTQTGLEESIERKSLLSNEFSLLINKNHIDSDNISISKSTFYTQESPCYNFNITTQIFGQSNESISCEPIGVIYLQKTFWGWKIDRFLPDYKTSVSFTVSK